MMSYVVQAGLELTMCSSSWPWCLLSAGMIGMNPTRDPVFKNFNFGSTDTLAGPCFVYCCFEKGFLYVLPVLELRRLAGLELRSACHCPLPVAALKFLPLPVSPLFLFNRIVSTVVSSVHTGFYVPLSLGFKG